MEYFHPHTRYSQNPKSATLAPALVDGALRAFGRDPGFCRLQKLSGGFMNANYLVSEGQERFVFRFHARHTYTAETERDVLRALHGTAVRVPGVLGFFTVGETAVTVLEFVDGIPLQERLLNGGVERDCYFALGAQLAEMHKITFTKMGFLGPGFQPGGEFTDSSTFVKGYMEETLGKLRMRPERMPPEMNEKFRRLINDKWNLVMATEPAFSLIHCDFNPKNILVTREGKARPLAILDWEFACVGNGITDLGNFFRFPYDYPDEARATFVNGYRSVRELPDAWEPVAKLLDLCAMCSFLERPEDYPETFRTARAIIQNTLREFSYE